MVRLEHGDCLEVMDKLIEEGVKVDAIITDPPYKIIKGGAGTTKKQPTGIFSQSNKLVRDGKLFKHNECKFSDWLPYAYKLLKSDAHIYIYVNDKNIKEAMLQAEKVGFKLHNVLVWVKNNTTPNRWYMKKAEFILFLRKGKAFPINNMGSSTVFIENNIKKKKHPTQKPIKQIETFIKNSTNEKDIILDLFMGSGTTGVAAKNLNRSFIGIEKDKEYFNIAKERIENCKKICYKEETKIEIDILDYA